MYKRFPIMTGIGASAAFPSITEIRPPMLFQEVGIKDVEQRLGWYVLADPEISVGLYIKREGAGQATPIQLSIPEVFFRSACKKFRFYKGGRIYSPQIGWIRPIYAIRPQFSLPGNNRIQPEARIWEFTGAVINNCRDLITVSLFFCTIRLIGQVQRGNQLMHFCPI